LLNRAGPYALSEIITPSSGVSLPARWGDVGKKMVAAGVIDEPQFKALYAQNGGLAADEQALLDSPDNGDLVITKQNAGVILNLLWAFGLGNKNPILGNGPMQNPQYGGAGNFASTGGWTVAVGSAMNHYSAHQFVTLTADEQALVESVAKNIYRPCCGNSTYFPDCNHGMAMLGLLELMASQGVTESQMYRAALAANSYWFPDTYLTISRYFAGKGISWNSVDPKIVLGAAYSSIQGYQAVQSQVAPIPTKSSANCGVSLQNQTGQNTASVPSSNSCGV
ncbi:MAG: hypothetical protein M1334_01340, partial [Patescibacteria group bacterium]|nr:hypothetical protein [Patescibacteria group bacterium]